LLWPHIARRNAALEAARAEPWHAVREHGVPRLVQLFNDGKARNEDATWLWWHAKVSACSPCCRQLDANSPYYLRYFLSIVRHACKVHTKMQILAHKRPELFVNTSAQNGPPLVLRLSKRLAELKAARRVFLAECERLGRVHATPRAVRRLQDAREQAEELPCLAG
jgi:hypothetical protein